MPDTSTARPSFAPRFAGWRLDGHATVPVPRRAEPATLQQLAGRTMGTTWSLRVDNPGMLPLEAIRAAVEAALDTVVRQMSHWEPGSDISRFNQAASGTHHTLPAEFATVLDAALRWAEASGGALDPSVGPLVALWGFGPEAHPARPDEAQLAAARARTGWRSLDFDRAGATLRQPGGCALDFSGIAKGHAVDLGVEALRALGLRDALFEVGGELRGIGRRPDGRAWTVQVEASGQPVGLQDMAIASSGDRWHVREEDGLRWSHTIDPRSGLPCTHDLASVAVLHERCMDADALATVLTVLGPEEGLAFADAHAVAALFARHPRRDDATGAPLLRASRVWAERHSPPTPR